MNSWTNLVMWDNISFDYVPENNEPVSENQLKEIKKTLNYYLNKIAYDGYISKNMVNMQPEIKINKTKTGKIEVEYNISAYPIPSPKKCPDYLFSIFPQTIKIDNLVLIKKKFYAI